MKQYTVNEYLKYLYDSLAEVFMLSMSGLNLRGMVNVPTWYLSVLVIAGYFLYTMLRNYKAAFLYLLGPLALLIIYTYFFRYIGCIQYPALGEYVVRGIYGNLPLLRGIADMSVGVFLYYLQLNKEFQQIMNRISGNVIFILEFACYGFVIIVSYFYSRTTLDFLYILVLSAAVSISYYHKINMGVKRYKVLGYMTKLCYPMYLNHNMFRELLPQFIPGLTAKLMLTYFIIVTIYSMVTMSVVDKAVHWINHSVHKI